MSQGGRRDTKVLTIDLRKLTHSGIGRYLANVIPGVLPRLHADRIQLLGRAAEIAALGSLPETAVVLEDESAPHSLHEQAFAFDRRIRPVASERRVLWVPHYNVPLLYRGPLVCTLHDLAPLDLQENFSAAKRMLARILLRHAGQKAAHIFTPSNFSRDRIVHLLSTPTSRITVTPLAVDTTWPSLADAPAPYVERDEDGNAIPYLLFVGNLKPNKNLTALLEALRLLGEAAPRLLVAGRTEGFRTADERGRRLAQQLGARVRLLGSVTDAELIALYRGAMAFVMPSLYEGFGLPILEAMRYGCPVLASNTTSIPEVAGSAALLFDPRDAAAIAHCIQKVLQKDVAAAMSEAGIRHEARFHFTGAVEATADALNHVLENAS